MENNPKTRRSSILKPQKQRVPFGEVEIHEKNVEDGETVPSRRRRVSFGNKLIKQFTPDEEKNTIWDTTFEQSIQISNECVTNITENVHLNEVRKSECNDFNESLDFTIPVGGSVLETTIRNQESMDFTNLIGNSIVEIDVSRSKAVSSLNKTKYVEENLDFTTLVGDSVLEIEKNPRTETENYICVNKSQKDLGINNFSLNMSMTQMIGQNTKLENTKNRVDLEKSQKNDNVSLNMSLTQAVGQNIQLKSNENNLNLEKSQINTIENERSLNMSITQVVGQNIQLGSNKNTVDFKKSQKNLSKNENVSLNMSITQAVGQNIQLGSSKSKVDLEKSQINPIENERMSLNMSITQAVGQNIQLGSNKNTVDFKKSQKNVNKNDNVSLNMSLTQAVGQNIQLRSNENNLNLEKSQINPIENERSLNMSITQAVGQNIQLRSNKNNKNTVDFKKSQKNINKNDNVSLNMSLTQAVGQNIQLKSNENNLNLEKSQINPIENEPSLNMSITQPVSQNIQLENNKNTVNLEKSQKNLSKNENLSLNLNTIQSAGENIHLGSNFECDTTNDNTEYLINYRLSEKNQTKAEENFEKLSRASIHLEKTNLDDFTPTFVDSIDEITNVCNLSQNEENSSLIQNENKKDKHEKTNQKLEITVNEIDFNFENYKKELRKISSKPAKQLNFEEMLNKLINVLDDLNKHKLNKEKENSVVDTSVSSVNNESDSLNESVEVKIKALQEDNKRYWKLLSVSGQNYKFSTYYDSIIIDVKLMEGSEKVEGLLVTDTINDDADHEAEYTQKVLLSKLSEDRLKAALGAKYDIRSLLDYIKENIHKQLDFLHEFDQLSATYRLIMNKDFRLAFGVFNPDECIAWKFFINMFELDCTSEKTVEYFALVGEISEINHRKIKKCRETSPCGTAFIAPFIEGVCKTANLIL